MIVPFQSHQRMSLFLFLQNVEGLMTSNPVLNQSRLRHYDCASAIGLVRSEVPGEQAEVKESDQCK